MDETELETRLRQLCEAGAGPDPQRLAVILRRVEMAASEKHRFSLKRHRWVMWLLLGGMATAAAAGYLWYSGRRIHPTAADNVSYTAPTHGLQRNGAASPESTGVRVAHGAALQSSADQRPQQQRATVIYRK